MAGTSPPRISQLQRREPPQQKIGLVHRDTLLKRLSAARGVILVCGPAGSGKSVLVRSWVHAEGLGPRTAWVSVERGERDPQRFWLAVVAALADVVGRDELVARVSPSPAFSGEAVVARLRSNLASLEESLLLVIDDLHELDSADATVWLERFLAPVPPMLRVVLCTRTDPQLRLHRLRLTGELTEIRAPDLRFTVKETRELLVRSGVKLADASVGDLHERTEGWAAGLRLAAISLAGHPDPERFVTEFSGSERTVAGYLLAEVLERQPGEVRELLLRTSVLDRVSGALADYLMGGSGAERTLQELEDANAFVTSLDVGRSWFRYHQLFADLLQLELRRVSPATVGTLHRAAAHWFEENGYPVDAVRHAQAARDWSHAARALADSYVDLTLRGQVAAVRNLLQAFPADAAADDAELALAVGTVRLLDGMLDESATYADLARRLGGSVPEERRPRFDVLLALLTLLVARWRGDLDTVLAAIGSLEAALAALPPEERASSEGVRAVGLLNLGVAELWSARVGDAQRDLEQALGLARRAGLPWLEITCLGHLGIAGPWTGVPLAVGLQRSEEALRIAEAHGWAEQTTIVSALATGAMALLWLGRFAEAAQWLERARRVLQPAGQPGTEFLVHHAEGLLSLVQHRFDVGLAAFRAAEGIQALLAGEHALLSELRGRVLQAQIGMGETAAARVALDGMVPDDRDRPEVRMAAAALALAEDDPETALALLAAVVDGAVRCLHPEWTRIEALLFFAVAHDRLGDARAAQSSLERALELAEPEGVILPFALAPIGGLLERHPRHRTSHATLLSEIRDVRAGSAPQQRGDLDPNVADLSDAELRVVRYLPSNLTVPEIAAELFVSNNTVRTHLRHVYAKLDAHSRADAVMRARELRVLAPSHRLR